MTVSFPDPVVVVDLAGAVERANPAARHILCAAPSDGLIPWIAPPPQDDSDASVKTDPAPNPQRRTGASKVA